MRSSMLYSQGDRFHEGHARPAHIHTPCTHVRTSHFGINPDSVCRVRESKRVGICALVYKSVVLLCAGICVGVPSGPNLKLLPMWTVELVM